MKKPKPKTKPKYFIGLTPVELQLIESEKWDIDAMCKMYGIPNELIEGKTYKINNMITVTNNPGTVNPKPGGPSSTK